MPTPRYDPNDIDSIFDHSKHLLGKCLEDVVGSLSDKGGKGGLGQLVEKHFFGFENNNRQEADFATAGVELKCTPLKRRTDANAYAIKERLVCSLINYTEDWDKTFEESNFFKKSLLMLILFYLHEKGIPKVRRKFIFTVLWRIPEKDLEIIKRDYETIISKIRAGLAHTLSEGDTLYLGACRKGQRGDTLMTQHNNVIGAPRRAWSLKPAYMRTLLEEAERHNVDGAYRNFAKEETYPKSLFTASDVRRVSVETLLLSRFRPHLGKTYSDILHAIGMCASPAKSKYFLLANHIATNGAKGNINQSEEFRKSGLTLKTIRIESDGKVRESMSFENIDYQEVLDCDFWEDSRLYELFTNRFLFVCYRATGKHSVSPNGEAEADYALSKVFFWTMPQQDLPIAKEYWESIKWCISTNHIDPLHFWRQEDNRMFHVRPKGRNAKDLTENPNGGMVKKYCYWINSNYIENIVNNGV